MNLYEAVLAGVIAFLVIGGMALWGYEGNQCKMEAIKAGMKAAEVHSACL